MRSVKGIIEHDAKLNAGIFFDLTSQRPLEGEYFQVVFGINMIKGYLEKPA